MSGAPFEWKKPFYKGISLSLELFWKQKKDFIKELPYKRVLFQVNEGFLKEVPYEWSSFWIKEGFYKGFPYE